MKSPTVQSNTSISPAERDRESGGGIGGDERGALDAEEQPLVPAWRRVTLRESRLHVSIAVIVVIAIQLLLPARVANHPWWVVAVLAAALLAGIVASGHKRIDVRPRHLRIASLVLIAILSTANVMCVTRLVIDLMNSEGLRDATSLLLTGGAIWVSNVIIFAIWYWEFDRGGPAARASATKLRLDLRFPQMESPEEFIHWEPNLIDYVYLSFTNSTAFSPSDVMPLSRWAKLTMMLQATISFATIALVVARAVSVFK
jgi:uncharacterized membrane protein